MSLIAFIPKKLKTSANLDAGDSKTSSPSGGLFAKLSRPLIVHIARDYLGDDPASLVSLTRCAKLFPPIMDETYQKATLFLPYQRSEAWEKRLAGFTHIRNLRVRRTLACDVAEMVLDRNLFPKLCRLEFQSSFQGQLGFNNINSDASSKLTDLVLARPNLISLQGKLENRALEALCDRELEELNFDNYNLTYFTPEELERCLKKLKNPEKLRKILICFGFTDKHLDVITKYCKGLEEVSFIRVPHVTGICMARFFENCKQLKRLYYYEGNTSLESSVLLTAITKHCPNLRAFSCTLERTGDDFFRNIEELLPRLTTFRLEGDNLRGFSSLLSRIRNLPNLRSLSLCPLYGTIDLPLFQEILLKSKLEYLSIDMPESNFNSLEIAMLTYVGHLPSLKYLQLSGRFLSDKFLDQIPMLYPKLHYLSFRYCEPNQFTKEGLVRLSRKCSSLQYMDTLMEDVLGDRKEIKEIFPHLKGLRTSPSDPHFHDEVLNENRWHERNVLFMS